MISLTFVEPDGTRHEVAANEGDTAMEAAVSHAVPGIEATCGGAAACGTCHIILEQKLIDMIGQADGDEKDMLDFLDDTTPNSRLGCQVVLDERLNQATIHVGS